MSFFLFIAYLSIASVLIPLSLAIPQWKRIPKEISSLRWLLVAGIIVEILGRILGIMGQPNALVYDVFMFIQFTVLMYIFSFQFERKVLLIIAYAGIVAFYSIGYFLNDDDLTALVSSNAIDGLVLISISLIFFYKLLSELKVMGIHRLPVLWIAFATLVYYSGNLFVFLAMHYVQTDDFLLTWKLHNILNVVKNILFAIALWQTYRTFKTSNG